MKVALISFPINDVGGITTWVEKFQLGLKRLNIENQLYYCAAQGTMKVDENEKIVRTRDTLLPGKFLSYKSEFIKQTIKTLNKYDVVVFTKASPHPTKANLRSPDAKNWMLLYEKVKVPKVVVFHDAKYKKTNLWFEEVADHVDIILAGQKKFMNSANEYPSDCLKYWDYHPFDLKLANKLTKSKKKPFGILATQWIKWKNHHLFLPQLKDIEHEVKLYGCNQEYYELKKQGVFQTVVDNDHRTGERFNKQSPHNYYGFVEHSELCAQYGKAMYGIDLSTRGYTNYTHFEPLFFGAVSVVEENVYADPDSILPEGSCLVYEMGRAWEYVNLLVEHYDDPVFKQMRSIGHEFGQNFDCKKVAKRFIKQVKNL